LVEGPNSQSKSTERVERMDWPDKSKMSSTHSEEWRLKDFENEKQYASYYRLVPPANSIVSVEAY